MNEQRLKQRSRLMRWLIVVAVIYVGFVSLVPTVTGNPIVDGTISVLLGLYICSHPAANMVDSLYFGQEMFSYLAAEKASDRWLILNALAMLIGWGVITLGVMRLLRRVG